MCPILAGIKVLDLTRVIAGPLTTQILADLGATVYKIEKPGDGDDTRRMGPFMPGTGEEGSTEESAVFMAYNRGKQSITVDIAKPEGAALVRRLAAQCDVVIENYKVGTLKKYGLDYETIRGLRPDIVYCSVTGFGQDGPYAARPAYDFILQGMAGPMSTCGQPDGSPGGEPMRTAIPVTDIVTGLYANIAVIGALYHRNATGQGQYIDAAMLDATVAFNGHLAVGYLMTGRSPTRVGNTNPIASPSEVFSCQDGKLIIAAGNNGQFANLCDVMGVPELVQDPRFATNAKRVEHRTALREILAPLLAAASREVLLVRLEQAGVPAGPVNDMAQVFADAQTQYRQMTVQVPHANGRQVTLVRNPIKFSATPVDHRPPPALGQHSLEVLRNELHLNDEEIQHLQAAHVI